MLNQFTWKQIVKDVDLSTAVNSGYLSVGSIYYRYMKKYNIDKIRMYEKEIIGPALGMIQLLENEYSHANFRYAADFFAGSLAYSQICTELGSKKIDAYDIYLENHYKRNKKIILHEQDLLSFEIPNRYDLILVEPPRKLHALFLKKMLQTPLNSIILFRLGYAKYVPHIAKCESMCKKNLLDEQWAKCILFDEVYLKIDKHNCDGQVKSPSANWA